MHQLFVAEQEDAQILDGEQVPATVKDLVEHRRGVGHRAADHLQHLGRGGLLLQRLLGLVEQPRVLDRDHRLMGKGLQQRDFLFREARRRFPDNIEKPHGLIFPDHRGKDLRIAADLQPLRHGTHRPVNVRIERIDEVQGLAAQNAFHVRLGRNLCTIIDLPQSREGRAVVGAQCDMALRHDQQDALLGAVEQFLAAPQDLVEHRRGVSDRRADCLQYFGGGRLMLQRLLGLVEQPHVLDGDDGLVGEGLDEADLPLVEGPDFAAPGGHDADERGVPQHRH